MNRLIPALACGLALLSVTGCKVVKTATTTAAGDPDDLLVAGIVEDTYAARLLPLIAAEAQPADQLLTAIAAGLDAAGEAHGSKGVGEGASWTFAIKGTGRVVAEDRKSRAAKAEVDVTGDGKPDLTLQLGPVVKGTALRDIAPFYDFTDFRDQIQFAKLSRALNTEASSALNIPHSLLDQTIAFEGAFALHSNSDVLLVTPTQLTVQP